MAPECKWISASNSSCSEEQKRSSVGERRKEGRYKTFDWAELSHMQKKRENLSRQLGMDSELICGDSVPPAPASTPEEPVAGSILEIHSEMYQETPFAQPAESLSLVRSNIVAGKPSEQKNTEDDGVDVFNDISNAPMETKNEVTILNQCNKH